jgi:glycosyltransferase involved in cell wall biosynthesis
VVTNSELARKALGEKYPEAARRMITIMNGTDDKCFEVKTAANCFRIAFAGTIYLDRNPRNFLRAVANVVQRASVTPDKFQLVFVGSVSSFEGQTLQSIALDEGLPTEFLSVRPAMPRKELFEFLGGASMLLSLPQDSTMAIPAKIFEYLQFNAWLLALTSEASATAELLQGTPADVVDPNDVEGMVRVIETRYRQFVNGDRPSAINQDDRFSRRLQAQRLIDAVESITSPQQATGINS